MGLFSGLKKGIKKIFSGIGKFFKKITDSKLGKALLIGAAIFVGGAMLGAWQGPAWLNGGAAAGAEAGAASAAPIAAPTAGSMASSTAAGEAAAAASATEAGAVAAGGMEAAAAGAAVPEAVVTSGLPAASGGGGGLISQVGAAAPFDATAGGAAEVIGGFTPASAPTGFLGKAGAFIDKHPMLAYGSMMAGGQMLAGAMAPDPYDQYVQQARHDRRRSNYAGVYGNGRAEDIRLPTAGLITEVSGYPKRVQG